MKKISILIGLMLALCTGYTQAAEMDVVVKDTIEYTTTNIVIDQDDSTTYITLFSMDKVWRSQVRYLSLEKTGEYGAEECGLTRKWGANYNYIRPVKSDFQFYSYKELAVRVSEDAEGLHIEVNGLINDWGTWRRVLIHGLVAYVAPKDTVEIALGQANVEYNALYQNYSIQAENEDYSWQVALQGEVLDGEYKDNKILVPRLLRKIDEYEIEGKLYSAQCTSVEDETTITVEFVGTKDNILYRIRCLYIAQETGIEAGSIQQPAAQKMLKNGEIIIRTHGQEYRINGYNTAK